MSASERSPLQSAVLAQRYRVIERVGSGSSGHVYRVFDELEDRTVALKLLGSERLGSARLLQLQGEFRVLRDLRPPRIARAYDFGYTEERLPFFTREYVDGRPLAAGPPPATVTPQKFLSPLLDVLDALEYLHERGVVHLDIHAGNLIETGERTRGVVLIDFGLARLFPAVVKRASRKHRGVAPPEISAGELSGPAADIYSVGRLLFERVTGSPDGEGRSIPDIPGWSPRLLLELERIIAKCLERDPRRRFRSTTELRRALYSLVGGGRPRERRREGSVQIRGRTRELARIEASIRAGRNGGAEAVWFCAPRGTGKTRLLREARAYGQLHGLEVVEFGFAREPMTDLVEEIRRTAQQSGGTASWLEPLSPQHGGSTADRCRRVVDAYFSGEVARPWVFLLDDIQLAHRESRLFIAAFLDGCARRRRQESTHRGLVLVVTSTESPPAPLGRSLRHATLQRLPALKSRDATQFLAALLDPLRIPRRTLETVAARTRGNPAKIREAARYIQERVRDSEKTPSGAEIVVADPLPRSFKVSLPTRLPDAHREVMAILAVLVAVDARSLSIAAEMELRKVRRILGALRKRDLIVAIPGRRPSVFCLADPGTASALAANVPKPRAKLLHTRCIEELQRSPKETGADLERLARHLRGAGRLGDSGAAAVRAARAFLEDGLLPSAVQVLEQALAAARTRRWRIDLSLELSALHARAGDHREGIDVLDRLRGGKYGSLARRHRIRVLCALGIHYHRAGLVDRALELFQELSESADNGEHVEEIARVESELAEIWLLRGDFDAAESACQRGLQVLESTGDLEPEVARQLRVTILGTLGHLDLRRLNLEAARSTLEEALELSGDMPTNGDRAILLNNLGIVYNQLNLFERARHCLARAERLLGEAGNAPASVQVNGNLAIIAAKIGDLSTARRHLARTEERLAFSRGERNEFVLDSARGIVALLEGDLSNSALHLDRAIARGRKLGDRQAVSHLRLFVVDVHIASGHYAAALNTLRRVGRTPGKHTFAALDRMIESRRFFLASLLRQPRVRAESLRLLHADDAPRIEYLEGWNLLYIGLGHVLLREDEAAREALCHAADLFETLGVPLGHRLALLWLSYLGSLAGTAVSCRYPTGPGDEVVRPLVVLQRLLSSDVAFSLGDLEHAETHLLHASRVIVGLPVLELDWRLELLRAQLAERNGDRDGARRTLHRCRYTVELLTRSLPKRLRDGLLSHHRFAALQELAERLEFPRAGGARVNSTPSAFDDIIGRSEKMTNLLEMVRQLADLDSPLLVSGETGTGKDLLARAIHRAGRRRDGPILALNCGSLPTELFEAELFGFERGAFTGAETASGGLLVGLRGGTLILDEIEALSMMSQATLLRVLDTKTVRPLGAARSRPIDVRVIAIANSDLNEIAERGRFRKDLLYRIAVAEIRLPPLRERGDDAVALARHFLAQQARRAERVAPLLGKDAEREIHEYPWPGNVRQLQAVLLRSLLATPAGEPVGGETIRKHLPVRDDSRLVRAEELERRTLPELRRALERQYLEHVFEKAGGDVDAMSERLGIKKARLYRWLRQVGLEIRELRSRGKGGGGS